MQKTPGVFMATAAVNFNYEWKFLATTEGSFIEQVFYLHRGQHDRDGAQDGQVKTRTYNPGTETRGWEFVTEKDMRGNAERVAAEAVEHAMAKPVGTGLKDLILHAVPLGAHDPRDRRPSHRSSIASSATRRTTRAPAS